MSLVGGGSNPKHSIDKILLWDDALSKSHGELKFKTPVKNVKMSKLLIAAVLEDRIYVYQLVDLTMKDAIETAPNPDGICVLNDKVLACPDKMKGEVRVNHYGNSMVIKIEAHNNNIVAIALNEDSTQVATSSDKGTLIRIFSTKDGSKLKEVR
jgi:WD repeat-containing protein 45